MPDAATKYALSSPNIVHETFEDEVVVVNLDSGSYYSLEGSATKCWDLALEGFSSDAIVDSLCQNYNVDRLIVEASVGQFLSDVCREGLLSIDPDSHSNSHSNSHFDSEPGNAPFSPPRLVRYDEMRQLLLIDPVHMVGDAGWPQQPAQTTDREDG